MECGPGPSSSARLGPGRQGQLIGQEGELPRLLRLRLLGLPHGRLERLDLPGKLLQQASFAASLLRAVDVGLWRHVESI